MMIIVFSWLKMEIVFALLKFIFKLYCVHYVSYFWYISLQDVVIRKKNDIFHLQFSY